MDRYSTSIIRSDAGVVAVVSCGLWMREAAPLDGRDAELLPLRQQ
jgi:hypothetical protein